MFLLCVLFVLAVVGFGLAMRHADVALDAIRSGGIPETLRLWVSSLVRSETATLGPIRNWREFLLGSSHLALSLQTRFVADFNGLRGLNSHSDPADSLATQRNLLPGAVSARFSGAVFSGSSESMASFASRKIHFDKCRLVEPTERKHDLTQSLSVRIAEEHRTIERRPSWFLTSLHAS